MNSKKTGLEEYQEALARANANVRAARAPVFGHHRPRGIAVVLLGLVFLVGSLAIFYFEWYGPTYGKPAFGTIVKVEGRGIHVAFTSAEGVHETGYVQNFAQNPPPYVGEKRDILYLDWWKSAGRVDAWDPRVPRGLAFPLIFTLIGLGSLVAGVIEFSGRAPWRKAVWLDERSVRSSAAGLADRGVRSVKE
ncbi:hypothetical protein ACQP1V_24985 [Microtetraspora malaysiensis]|uniref:hypothetical protein n=1 Tax=Microtetraspora malaysiensis TaxID=161358 RepID=UPI003D8CEA60